jgi:hypothetical protein
MIVVKQKKSKSVTATVSRVPPSEDEDEEETEVRDEPEQTPMSGKCASFGGWGVDLVNPVKNPVDRVYATKPGRGHVTQSFSYQLQLLQGK